MVEIPYPGELTPQPGPPPPAPPIEVQPAKSHWRHRETEQHIYEFRNGWHVSVIRGVYSYGGPDGLWEAAPVDPSGYIDSDSVVGYLTDGDLAAELLRIAARPSPL